MFHEEIGLIGWLTKPRKPRVFASRRGFTFVDLSWSPWNRPEGTTLHQNRLCFTSWQAEAKGTEQQAHSATSSSPPSKQRVKEATTCVSVGRKQQSPGFALCHKLKSTSVHRVPPVVGVLFSPSVKELVPRGIRGAQPSWSSSFPSSCSSQEPA